MKTESKTYPKIQRSRKEGMIFFPEDIQKIQRETLDGEKEVLYEYNLIRIPDKGQQIENWEKFREENEIEIRKAFYNIPLNRGWISKETIIAQEKALILELEATTNLQMLNALKAQIKILQNIIFGKK